MKVLYAGDSCIKIGPIFLASPFNLEVKGVSHHIWGQPLIDALTKDGIEVKHLTNDQAISEFPRTVEDLSQYDVLIISDCECEVLSLYPFWIPGTPQNKQVACHTGFREARRRASDDWRLVLV